jgi:hypothetical protein
VAVREQVAAGDGVTERGKPSLAAR